MKRAMWLILILVFPAGVFASDENRDQDRFECPRLDLLIKKSNEEVKKYQGFHVNVLMFDKTPRITINFETILGADEQTPTVTEKLLLFVSDGSSKELSEKVDGALRDLSSLSGNDENGVRCFSINDKEGFENVIKYELLDSAKRVRLIQWRDQDTGFNYQTAMFSTDGKLISFETWVRLKVNGPLTTYVLHPRTMTAKQFLAGNKGFDFKNLDTLEDFIEKTVSGLIQ